MSLFDSKKRRIKKLEKEIPKELLKLRQQLESFNCMVNELRVLEKDSKTQYHGYRLVKTNLRTVL